LIIGYFINGQGCDGSILLDDTITLEGEKKASANQNSLKGFKIVDRIKNELESECPGIVSCADILTIAARDAVILVRRKCSNIGANSRSVSLTDHKSLVISFHCLPGWWTLLGCSSWKKGFYNCKPCTVGLESSYTR
jgi:hypothetical protein